MKRPIIAGVLGLVMVVGGWWVYGYAFDTYSPQEVAAASEIVKGYYSHLLADDYHQALVLLARPGSQVRDWGYEREWRSGYLQKLSDTGEYRILRYGGPELMGGPAGNRPRRDPLTFYATMDVEINGKGDLVAENILVDRVDGIFRIVGFQSTDHYVRFRAHEFELSLVANPWVNTGTKPTAVAERHVIRLEQESYRQVHFLRYADSVWQIDAEETLVWTGFSAETNRAYIATTRSDETYRCPRGVGRLTIAGIEGDKVRFRSVDGGVGWFDLETHEWEFDRE